VPHEPASASYRALLAIPDLGRVVASMQLSRIANAMVGVALVLFALLRYDSPALAGVVTFASLVPGLIVSPVAGALLDRHGRVRLVQLDYLVAAGTMVLIGGLALADALPAPLLVAIAAVSSLTGPLSATGLRSLFPLMVPRELWERVNAVDSNGYVIATIIGPPLAAALVAGLGPEVGVIVIALPLLVAAAVLAGVREPRTATASSGRLLLDAWQGLTYVARNPTLRGLGVSISALNLAGGMISIVIPLLVLDHLGGSEFDVGLVFAVSGVAGMVSVLAFGRLDTRGREWSMLWVPMLAMAPATALLFGATGDPGAAAFGMAMVVGSLIASGLLNGPLDIAMFTIRQRRTDPAWLGRAFAVSMALNFAGYPIGAALAGVLADVSLDAAILMGVVACVAAAASSALLVPRREPEGAWLRGNGTAHASGERADLPEAAAESRA
jgi:MFS family permease